MTPRVRRRVRYGANAGIDGPRMLLVGVGIFVCFNAACLFSYDPLVYIGIGWLLGGSFMVIGLFRTIRPKRVAIRGKCPSCGYKLTVATGGRCPECGAEVDASLIGEAVEPAPPDLEVCWRCKYCYERGYDARERCPGCGVSRGVMRCVQCGFDVRGSAGGRCPRCQSIVKAPLLAGVVDPTVCFACKYTFAELRGECCPECGEQLVIRAYSSSSSGTASNPRAS